MRTIKNWKAAAVTIAMTIVSETAHAQRYRWHYPRQVVTVATRLVQVSLICNNPKQKERLTTAIAYLDGHILLF